MAKLDIASFKFRAGRPFKEQVNAARLEALRETASKGRLAPSGHVGVIVRESDNGRVLEVKRQPQQGAAERHPWKPVVTGGLTVRILPGSIDGRVPENWNDTLNLTPSVTNWAYLNVGIDGSGNVTTVNYVVNAEAIPTVDPVGTDGELPTNIYWPLFSYTTSEESVTKFIVVAKKNLTVQVDTEISNLCDLVYRQVRILEV